jgi:hypothetical protein
MAAGVALEVEQRATTDPETDTDKALAGGDRSPRQGGRRAGVQGTVFVDAEGGRRPASGVSVRALDGAAEVVERTRTHADGRYRFDELTPGRYVIRETAQARASIRGSVRRAADGRRQAVAGVRVRLLDVRGQVVQRIHSTAAGQYRFDGVAPGRYNVRVARDPSKAGVSVRAITVEPGQGVTQVQPLTAERDPVDREKTADAEAITPSEGVIRGTVYVRHNGAYYQAGGVRVRLLDRRGQVVRQGESAGNGRYRFTGVPTGRYEVHVPNGAQTGADSHVERVRLTAGEAGVRGVDVVVAPGHVGQVGRRRSATGPDAPDGRIADPGIPGNWLAGQGPGRYTIQLIGLQTQAAARAFIERHGLAGRALYLRTQHDGERWFPVLYGSFDTRAAAQSARARLPASLKRVGPWLRPIDQLRSAAPPAAAEVNSAPGTA